MPIMGWIDGMASETLPISVEPVGRASHSAQIRKWPPQRLRIRAIKRRHVVVVPHLGIRLVAAVICTFAPVARPPASKQR